MAEYFFVKGKKEVRLEMPYLQAGRLFNSLHPYGWRVFIEAGAGFSLPHWGKLLGMSWVAPGLWGIDAPGIARVEIPEEEVFLYLEEEQKRFEGREEEKAATNRRGQENG